MHWTAFLAYRRFPANARVMDDLACVQCGYNLRSQMVSSRCPECGHEVGNSIFLLAKPDIAARGLRAAAPTYAAPLIIILSCLNQPYWPLLVCSGVMTLAGVFRLWGVSELRFRAALSRLPVLGPRLQLWWIASVIDIITASIWCAMVLVVANSITLRTAGGAWILLWLTVAWWSTSTFSAWAAGRFGFALMDMLGYTWTRLEFRAQQISVIVAAIVFPMALLGMNVARSQAMELVMLGILGLITAAPHLQTAIALLHAASAAEASTETWDELIDSERIVLIPEASMPKKPEPPAIKVE
jgi:hypothetical protein